MKDLELCPEAKGRAEEKGKAFIVTPIHMGLWGLPLRKSDWKGKGLGREEGGRGEDNQFWIMMMMTDQTQT